LPSAHPASPRPVRCVGNPYYVVRTAVKYYKVAVQNDCASLVSPRPGWRARRGSLRQPPGSAGLQSCRRGPRCVMCCPCRYSP
jgi:hypothetical protein